MDELDETIRARCPHKQKTRSFHQLLEAVDLSHNTLRFHLDDRARLPFNRLEKVYQFEKGGFCKKVGMVFEARNCPQIDKWG